MAKYTVSSFGRTYVSDEQIDKLPDIRWAFVIITLLLGFGTLLKFLRQYITIRNNKEKTCNYFPLNSSVTRIVVCYIASHLIHTIHFADNIYRPVNYFEPKWLYDKYLIAEMEITFFANFPISLCGLIFMEQLIVATSKRNFAQMASACKKMSFYIFGSFLTVKENNIKKKI